MTDNHASRDRLLAELRTNTWVALKPSPIEGIGVFAIGDIPKGCRDMFGKPDADDHWISIARADVDALPGPARHLVETYCLYDAHHYFVPRDGFKKIDLACYLNHSETPNVQSVNDGDYFEALRDIRTGEELLIDYGELVDGD